MRKLNIDRGPAGFFFIRNWSLMILNDDFPLFHDRVNEQFLICVIVFAPPEVFVTYHKAEDHETFERRKMWILSPSAVASPQ